MRPAALRGVCSVRSAPHFGIEASAPDSMLIIIISIPIGVVRVLACRTVLLSGSVSPSFGICAPDRCDTISTLCAFTCAAAVIPASSNSTVQSTPLAERGVLGGGDLQSGRASPKGGRQITCFRFETPAPQFPCRQAHLLYRFRRRGLTAATSVNDPMISGDRSLPLPDPCPTWSR